MSRHLGVSLRSYRVPTDAPLVLIHMHQRFSVWEVCGKEETREDHTNESHFLAMPCRIVFTSSLSVQYLCIQKR
jgi:hypothetical protein